ncbi:hypothetical protein A3715_32635 [Oleiphilus sp. HI0009]|nr:hypothetical protein A3715_19310 [Oleiphilus sp. HI0009]KZX83238.1 hypothetical protein A3715_32635 [Oleiphilus sp. HI0009]
MEISGVLVFFSVFAILSIVLIAKSIVMVDQGYQVIIERLGKYQSTLAPGLNFIFPFIDSKAFCLTTKEVVLSVPPQDVITSDNVMINVDAVAYFQITTPKEAVYSIEDYEIGISNLVQTTLRAIIGSKNLDETLSSREVIKTKLIEDVKDNISGWGISLKNVELKDVQPSSTMLASMEEQAAAERSKRATITKSEGDKEAVVLEAEGQLEASRKEAEGIRILAEAQKTAINDVQEAIGDQKSSATFLLGEKYINALRDLGASENSKLVLLPSDIQSAAQSLFKK